MLEQGRKRHPRPLFLFQGLRDPDGGTRRKAYVYKATHIFPVKRAGVPEQPPQSTLMDCPTLVRETDACLGANRVMSLYQVSRMTASSQYRRVTPVPDANVQPTELALFAGDHAGCRSRAIDTKGGLRAFAAPAWATPQIVESSHSEI